MSNKIFVGNLSYSANTADLEEAFRDFGTIQDVKIVKDRATGKSRGFGFVTFSTEDEAKRAIAMDGKEVNGRKIRVNEARDKQGQGGQGER
jgi:RNA recognition motif-containing protein